MGLCCPKVIISTGMAASDSKYSSQVFLKIKRETDLSPLEVFDCTEITFSFRKTKHCNGKFHASLAQLECQKPLRMVCLVHQSTSLAAFSSAPTSSLVSTSQETPCMLAGDGGQRKEGWCLMVAEGAQPRALPLAQMTHAASLGLGTLSITSLCTTAGSAAPLGHCWPWLLALLTPLCPPSLGCDARQQ